MVAEAPVGAAVVDVDASSAPQHLLAATCTEKTPRFLRGVSLLETTRACHVWSLSIVSSSVALPPDAALLGIVVSQVRWMPRPIPSSGTRCREGHEATCRKPLFGFAVGGVPESIRMIRPGSSSVDE